MKSRLILTTDRKSASEGEYIEIRWACDACPDSLYLAIDSGCTQYSIDVRVKATKKAGTKVPLSSRMKMFGEKMKAKWYVFRANMKYWWLSQKKWQKALWIALLALWLGLLFSSIGRKPEVKVSSDKIQTAYIFS